MRRCLLSSLLSVLVVSGLSAKAAPYPDRFVWVFGWGLRRDADVAEITKVLESAAKSGLNGAVLSASLDSLCKQPPEYFRRLREVQRVCDSLGLELIPSLFSVGYGGGTLGHNRHLAEGLPVEDAPFAAGKDTARFLADASVRLSNGGFEEFANHRFKGFNFHDEPGVISFADTEIFHSGKASARLENFTAHPNGNGRINQEVRLRPHRCYRVSVWVKTEGLRPASGFRLTVLAQNRDLAPRTFNLPSTTDWRKLTTVFNSLDFDSVRLYAGVWEGKDGKVWLDDWTLEEIGPVNVLRRPGTPVTVRNEDGTATFEEDKDYEALQDPDFSLWNVDRPAPSLRLAAGGRIRDGERLRVSWFHPMVIHESQVTVCMAEPEVYQIWEHEAKLLAEHLRPRRVQLNMDEVRMGGTCLACRGKDMAALLGECVTRQAQILRRSLPDARIYVWSDMFDPNHNARTNYYLVKGDYAGSWRHIPKDLVISVWGGAPRPKSLRFFADLGFETLVACYYDANDLNDVKGWLRLAGETPKVRGFMYTPWQRKYGLLPAFGDMLREAQ
ncbi:MAG: hypothetical protein HY735_34820 [Verrucomicrobia bacterium]|nr:hypothetical protein [Verrucomicrobiota bacterium]